MNKSVECVWENIPLDAASLLNIGGSFADLDGTVMLYSGGTGDMAKKSYIYLFPYQQLVIHSDHYISSRRPGNPLHTPAVANPWEWLQSHLDIEEDQTTPLPRWVGYLSFEMHHSAGPNPHSPPYSTRYPLAFFERCVLTLVQDRTTDTAALYLDKTGLALLPEREAYLVHKLLQPDSWLKRVQKVSLSPTTTDWILAAPPIPETLYHQKIIEAQERIRAGDIYQVCLSQRFLFSGEGSTFAIARHLLENNPSAYAAYIKVGDQKIISSSPERFLIKEGQQLETRPIKGTAPRGKTPAEDQKLRKQLLSSEKERAELLMITDLMRNDLGSISQVGTVDTPNLWQCEAFPNVYHLFSTVRSFALPDLHPIEMLRACFPPGSISGCPKRKALEVIHSLEQRPRGLYTGAIGHIFSNGDFNFSVAIRTVVASNDELEVQLGGAIVQDSDPAQEYQETLHKGSSIFNALKSENLA